MPRLMKQRSRKAGLSPGTLVHIGDKRAEKTRIILVVMIVVALGMLTYSRKKRWL